MINEILKILGLMFFCGTKILLGPGAALTAGYSRMETILIVFAGASIGSIVFFKLGNLIFSWFGAKFPSKKKKKKFTKKNRFIVNFKKNFGVIGLALIIPIISIPASAMISAKYFDKDPKTIPAFIFSSALWAVVLTFFSEPIIEFFNSLW